MEEKMPVGLKVTRIINFILIGLSAIVGILMAMIAVPNFIKAAQNAGAQANIILLIIVGLISFAVGFIPGVLLILINKGLRCLNKNARVSQIIISCLFLLVFPIGTILNLAILYFMLFDKSTKEAFSATKVAV